MVYTVYNEDVKIKLLIGDRVVLFDIKFIISFSSKFFTFNNCGFNLDDIIKKL